MCAWAAMLGLPWLVTQPYTRKLTQPYTQDYVQGAHGQMTGDEGAVQGAMLQGVLLASVWLRPMCVYG